MIGSLCDLFTPGLSGLTCDFVVIYSFLPMNRRKTISMLDIFYGSGVLGLTKYLELRFVSCDLNSY